MEKSDMKRGKNKSSRFQLLHISDLHVNVNSGEKFDRTLVLDPLIDRVMLDRDKNGLEPEIVIVSGDIASSGKKEEYIEAKKFFDDLLAELKLPKERLFLVPGNHDVDRKKYRPRDIPQYDKMKQLNLELEDEGYRADLFKGLGEYFNFVEKYYPHLTSMHGNLVPFVQTHHAKCGKKIGLVGLNSAWMYRKQKSTDRGKIAIGEYQIKNAMEEVAGHGGHDLVIAVFHHPLYWLWDEDRKICRTWFNDKMLLSGHFHDADAIYSWDLQGKCHRIIAGSINLGSHTELPRQFHYQTVDWVEGQIRLDLRKTRTDNKTWIIDTDKGDDKGQACFSLNGRAESALELSSAPLEIPSAYRNWVSDHCKTLNIDKLREESEIIQISLTEIYIPLFAALPGAKKIRRDKLGVERQIDIEKLASTKDRLLVQGQAGTGKTTLLKHMAYTVIHKTNEYALNDYLPVLVFLKDLQTIAGEITAKTANSRTARELLEAYMTETDNGLDMGILMEFVDKGRALFLIDGLDEIDPEFQNLAARSMADFMATHEGNKIVLAGRPHGLNGGVSERFGEHRVNIRKFTIKQVELFINKWFEAVYDSGSKICRKTAEEMICEIKDHPGIERLIDNPLMLTAVCILYHDWKKLPCQWAELY